MFVDHQQRNIAILQLRGVDGKQRVTARRADDQVSAAAPVSQQLGRIKSRVGRIRRRAGDIAGGTTP